MDLWQVSQGEDAAFVVTINGDDGNPITTYDGTQTFTVKVWPGGDQAPVAGVATATWANHGLATVNVVIAGSATTSTSVGKYRVKLILNDSGAVRDAYEGSLEIIASPGVTATLPVYCTYQDMLRYAPWLGKQQDIMNDEAGFLLQRNNARTWLEQIIQAHYRLQGSSGITAFGWPVPTAWGPTREGGNDKTLQGYLDAGYLMTAPPRRVVEITAKYAVGVVLQAQLTGTDAKDSVYQSKAEWFLAEANALVVCYTAEIDTNSDGYPELVINCGTADCLYG